jgi:hypothetical protein
MAAHIASKLANCFVSTYGVDAINNEALLSPCISFLITPSRLKVIRETEHFQQVCSCCSLSLSLGSANALLWS